MYSSYISAPVVNVSTVDKDILFCELVCVNRSWTFVTMELYPVDWWYQYNVDGFGKAHYDEWDLFWFHDNLSQWHEVPYW